MQKKHLTFRYPMTIIIRPINGPESDVDIAGRIGGRENDV